MLAAPHAADRPLLAPTDPLSDVERSLILEARRRRPIFADTEGFTPQAESPCPTPSLREGMTRPIVIILMCAFCAAESKAQIAVELSYGADRNVESAESELDSWLNGTVEWMFPSGLGFGIGTDHQFEDSAISASGHLGWAIYLSTSFEFPADVVAPFVRGGIGVGRAPCRGDTCGGGAYLRGSAGVRIRIVGELRVSGEFGISRVSRPFGGAGVSFRF